MRIPVQIAKHSGTILAGMAAAGVISTAVLSAKCHLAAQEIRYEISDNRGETIANAFKARWKIYAPAVISAALTIAAIVGSKRVDAKRLAAIGASYAAAEQSLEAYRKAIEKVLPDDSKPRKELEQAVGEIVQKTAKEDSSLVIVGDGKVLCFDTYTGRYFSATREDIRAAVNDVNVRILNEDYCPLNEFYSRLGLEEVQIGDELGWNSDHRCDIQFSSTLNTEGKPCLAISFRPNPIPGWWTRG